jgi:hypothetical protein
LAVHLRLRQPGGQVRQSARWVAVVSWSRAISSSPWTRSSICSISSRAESASCRPLDGISLMPPASPGRESNTDCPILYAVSESSFHVRPCFLIAFPCSVRFPNPSAVVS